MTKIKALAISYYRCHQEIITIILLHLGVLWGYPRTAYRHLDCNISPNSVPNIALVNEARKVKWFVQVHNTLAVAALELTNFELWLLHVSTWPHVPHVNAFDDMKIMTCGRCFQLLHFTLENRTSNQIKIFCYTCFVCFLFFRSS